jgi:hypothetical protein
MDFDPYEHAEPAMKNLREQAKIWQAADAITNAEREKLNALILAAREAGIRLNAYA